MKVKLALAGDPDVSVIVDGASDMGGPWTRAARTRKQEAGALVHVAGRQTGRIRRMAPAGAPSGRGLSDVGAGGKICLSYPLSRMIRQQPAGADGTTTGRAVTAEREETESRDSQQRWLMAA